MITLTEEKKAELYRVNAAVNRSVKYVTDKDLYGKDEFWTIAEDNKGDCDDYAITKMWKLMELGWPREDLRLATCWAIPNDDSSYHAVLTVETDKGTLILDNMTGSIRTWSQTGYQWHKREVPGKRQWELLLP